MISYAQNGEDVVLARAFRDVATGFYVDLGAADPVLDSVTKHFYDRGWSGVNVEPLRDAYAALEAERPRDVNLRVAIGPESGMGRFFEALDAPGLSTFDPDRADAAGRVSRLSEYEVPMTTLRELFEEHVGDQDVEFLKIDVEGLEHAVLSTGDWERFRPRVLVIEGDPGRVEGLLVEARYRQMLWDGINSFWVRQEDAERLAPAFARPALRAVDGYQPWYDLFPLRDAVHALLACRLRMLGRSRVDDGALRAVAQVYASRPDVRAAFGEPLALDIPGLLRWAVAAPAGDEPAAVELASHQAALEQLADVRDPMGWLHRNFGRVRRRLRRAARRLRHRA